MSNFTPEQKWDFSMAKTLRKVLVPTGYQLHRYKGKIPKQLVSEREINIAIKCAIVIQRDFKEQLLIVIAERKVTLDKEIKALNGKSWLGRIRSASTLRKTVVEYNTLTDVQKYINDCVPSNVQENDLRKWPTDLKTGDWVFDEGLQHAVKLANEDEVAIYKKNWTNNRFATEAEIFKAQTEPTQLTNLT